MIAKVSQRRRSSGGSAGRNAARSFESQESSYKGALALWDLANPNATYSERDTEALRLRRVHKV